MTKGIIYYTDNRLGDPIFSIVQEQILKAGLPVVSVSLKPIAFGENVVLAAERGYPTMVRQIIAALEKSTADYVFFCEHDVLYHPTHFDFTPPNDHIFYYNSNVWRWNYPHDQAVTYDRLLSLSALCVNRRFALEHYKARLRKIEALGLGGRGEPEWARKMGYEPGTKKKKRGGFSDDDFETWRSALPNVDIRHAGTFSPPKVTLASFKHLPANWREVTLNQIPGWHLKKLFGLNGEPVSGQHIAV